MVWSGITTTNSLDFKLRHKGLHLKENQVTLKKKRKRLLALLPMKSA